jgi:hypothetical protein
MPWRTEELEDTAWECRALANAARYEPVREQLLEVAEQFKRLAQYCRLPRSHTHSSKIEPSLGGGAPWKHL